MNLYGALTLFLAATAQATVTAEALVDKLTQFKGDAWKLQGPARLISPLDALLLEYKVGGAYVCIKGLTEIAQDAVSFAENLQDTPPFSGKAAEDIYHAYTGFVGEHVKLLDILSNSAKNPLFPSPVPPLGKAMYTALAEVQVVASAFAGFFKGAVPSMAPQFAAREAELIPALGNCLNSWVWVCGDCCREAPPDAPPEARPRCL